MVIAVDAMGGDSAPREVVAGAVSASRAIDDEICLVGDSSQIDALLCELASPHIGPGRITVRHADGVVPMDGSPRAALQKDHHSSMADSVEMVCEGEADAVVSAGNSGAFMALATMRLKRLPDISRPAIAVPLPTANGVTILLDGGANADCKPRHLLEFAMMGSSYAEYVLERDTPQIGLVNIGEEPTKGNTLTQEAYGLLARAPLNFIGNVETNSLANGVADVAVCDGFVGNIVLKTYEGVAKFLLGEIKEGCRQGLRTRIGAFFMKPLFRTLKAKCHYAEYGGALLLGVNGVCVVGHGRSDARAMCRAIQVAADALEHDILQHMKDSIKQIGQTGQDPAFEAPIASDA